MSDEDKTIRKLAFTIIVDIPLPPEGSEALAKAWGGATTHEQALQHEADFYKDGEGDIMELLSFVDSDIVAARIVEPL